MCEQTNFKEINNYKTQKDALDNANISRPEDVQKAYNGVSKSSEVGKATVTFIYLYNNMNMLKDLGRNDITCVIFKVRFILEKIYAIKKKKQFTRFLKN